MLLAVAAAARIRVGGKDGVGPGEVGLGVPVVRARLVEGADEDEDLERAAEGESTGFEMLAVSLRDIFRVRDTGVLLLACNEDVPLAEFEVVVGSVAEVFDMPVVWVYRMRRWIVRG